MNLRYNKSIVHFFRCRMHLLKFPLDSQICPLWIGSYGYASRDLQYRWRENGGVSIDDLSTAQFLITDMPQGVVNDRTNRLTEYGFRNDSVAYLHFYLERQTGFFLLQVSTGTTVWKFQKFSAIQILREINFA